jgi:nitric oxide reductase large subunit
MQLDALRLIEHVHGHLGWLSAAILLHPAIVLRNRKRPASLAVGLATAFVTVASASGAWLYVAYRERLKQGIFQHAPSIGLLFERKEHLAFGAVVLAWAGAAAYYAAPRAPEETRERLRTIAFRAFAAAAALSVLVAVLGTIVAVYRGF